MTIALERPVGTTDPATLVDPEVTERLARRITADHPEITEAIARRIVGQAAAFIATSGSQPGQSLAPSQLVDYGWHAFILHTVDYARRPPASAPSPPSRPPGTPSTRSCGPTWPNALSATPGARTARTAASSNASIVQDSSRPASQPGGWPYERSTT